MSDGPSEIDEPFQRPPNPFDGASLISQLTFTWPLPFIKKGLEAPIEDKDIPDLLPEEDSVRCRLWVEQVWEEEQLLAAKKKRKPRLHIALVKLYWRSLWHVQPNIVLTSASRICQALAVGQLVALFEEDGMDGQVQHCIMWTLILIGCACVPLITHHQTYFRMWRFGMQLRIGAIGAMFAKSLRLKSTGAGKKASGGELLNLASNDVERFIYASLFFSYLFFAPLEALAVLGVGVYMLGPAFAAGYCVLFTFVPLQFYLGKMFARYRSAIATVTDQRVSLVSQAMQGARVMKMNGWELQFAERIKRIRQKEVKQIRGASQFRALNEAIFFATSISVAIVIFIVHVHTGNELTPTNVFTTFSLINLVQFTMTKFFAYAVMSVSECSVSIRRIQQFLQLPEVDAMTTVTNDDDAPLVTIEGVSSYWEPSQTETEKTPRKPKNILDNIKARWLTRRMRQPSGYTCGTTDGPKTKEDDVPDETEEKKEELDECQDAVALVQVKKPQSSLQRSHQRSKRSSIESFSQRSVALENISLQLNRGQLYCIIGPVGCGKSALLSTLAGELKPTVGEVQRGTASIAFAAQDPWIMDGTVRENILLGEPYEESRYQEIIDACALAPDIASFHAGDETLLGDRGVQCSGGQRARIGLARALYRDADLVLLDDPLSAVDAKVARIIFDQAIHGLCVSRGKCVVLATHQYQLIESETCILMKRGSVVQVAKYEHCIVQSAGLLKSSIKSIAEEPEESESPPVTRENDEDSSSSSSSTSEEQLPTALSPALQAKQNKDNQEGRGAGSISISTWKAYMNAMGGPVVVSGILGLFMVTQAALLVAIAKIGRWAERPFDEQSSWDLITPVLIWVVVVMCLSLFRSTSAYFLMLKASRDLHDRMTISVLRAKVEFFDTNPLGRILNRFSSDVGSNDDQLPAALSDTFSIGFIVVGGIITAASVMPFLLIAVPFIFWYFARTRRIFVTTSREVKRLVGVSRSPVFGKMSESMQGIASIRANNATEYFLNRFAAVQNSHSCTFFAYISCTRWLNFRLEALQVTLLSTASVMALIFNNAGWFQVDPAILGLTLTLLVQMSGLVQWAVRQSSEALNQMVAVERVAAYGNLPFEAPLHMPSDNDLDDSWPSDGTIEIKNLQVRYRESLPPAVSDLSVSVKGGERVGICGRTGSGKSTLLQALFRLLESEEGSIHLDGVDISKLGLHKLRKSISVIPQTPVLFSDWTLRDNLDPFLEYKTTEIEAAISKVQLDDIYYDLPDGLDTLVTDDGSNFSTGQRQLLCTARAILQQRKYLVLDEPTAHVDSQTDALLQIAIGNSFPGATIMAIAHRLQTIIDYDAILVIGNGKRLEYGPPDKLLETSDSQFARMVAETGASTQQDLYERASISGSSRRSNSIR